MEWKTLTYISFSLYYQLVAWYDTVIIQLMILTVYGNDIIYFLSIGWFQNCYNLVNVITPSMVSLVVALGEQSWIINQNILI